jgi:hypothetical protein
MFEYSWHLRTTDLGSPKISNTNNYAVQAECCTRWTDEGWMTELAGDFGSDCFVTALGLKLQHDFLERLKIVNSFN